MQETQLQRTIDRLLESQPDDLRLRDHLEGISDDERFPGLTWYWGPLLYARNRAVFRGLIFNRFSEWRRTSRRWKRIRWVDHAERLETWLAAARINRDVQLVRRLLRWKHAASNWGVDSKAWSAALLQDYQAAETAAARAIVLDEYDSWFELDEETAMQLYRTDPNCRDFLIKHLPQTFWGVDKRKLWEALYAAADAANDTTLRQELYRRQVPIKRWQDDILQWADQIQNPERLCEQLLANHPTGYGLRVGGGLVQLLEARGRDVMPYVRSKLPEALGGWYGDDAKPFIKLAEQRNWWDLWAAAIRGDRNDKRFNKAVASLIADDASLGEEVRLHRLRSLAGMAREWNGNGFGFAQIHGLKDEIAESLYRRYPDLIHTAFKPHITPTWWQGYPKLLSAAQKANDTQLVDLLASRYVTRMDYGHASIAKKSRNPMLQTADALADHYEGLRDRDAGEFARRAANVLTQIPAFAIFSYDQVLETNRLARLLFVRSFAAYLEVPDSVRDLVEGSEIHVQMLAYRVLGQDDQRARDMAVKTLDILIGTLLRPLHRKTRLAAFEALLNAARNDAQSAALVLERAREAVRLPDKRYPKEQLIGLIGQILHLRPELRSPAEQPVVFGLNDTEPVA